MLGDPDLDGQQGKNGLHDTLKEERDEFRLAARVHSVRVLPADAAAARVTVRHLAAQVESEACGEEDGLQEEEGQDAKSRVDTEGTQGGQHLNGQTDKQSDHQDGRTSMSHPIIVIMNRLY